MGIERNISDTAKKIILKMQQNEITEFYIYTNIAKSVKDEHNKNILFQIANEEKKHANIWQSITKQEVKPSKLRILYFTIISNILGFTFALKLLEHGEDGAFDSYTTISEEVPEAKQISEDEKRHEKALIDLLDEERLQYVGSMVLGLSDALVELTGTLAGLTFALQNNKLVALSGLITGISATLSMGSSEFLSARSEGHKNPLKSCMYTGIVYLITVAFLVLPYLILPPTAFIQALIILLVIVVIIIFSFTYYISVAKDLPFKKRFIEMAGISLSVAAVSFCIGLVVKQFLKIDI